MKIDDYLNELQSNLDEQLSKFGFNSSNEDTQKEKAAVVETGISCPECGAQIPDDANFCPACGYNLHSDECNTEDDTPNQSAEKKMRTVELTVWTGWLGMVDITPVSKSYANKYIGSGEEPDDLYDRFEDTCSVYFVNGNENVNLKVKDGDKELSFDKLPQLDYRAYDDYRGYTLKDWLEENWEGEEDEKPQSDAEIIKYVDENYDYSYDDGWPVWKMVQKVNLDQDDVPSVFSELWEQLKKDGYLDFVNYLRLQAKEYNEAISGDGVNYCASGSPGKGQVTFYIELPEDEEFDINKLHFVCSDDWWDTDFGLMDECYNALNGMDVLLEAVEYDGHFYRMQDPFFVPGWKDFGGAKFLDCDMNEVEYDEDLDDEEEDDDDDKPAFPIEDGEALVPEDATEIPEDAFCRNEDLRNITIPNSVTSIGGWAFLECENLEEVVFGNGVETIGDCAFQGCEALTKIVLPESVTSLGEASFARCSSLETITLGGSISEISWRAFDDLDSLQAIYVPAGKADYYKELLKDENLADLVQELPE